MQRNSLVPATLLLAFLSISAGAQSNNEAAEQYAEAGQQAMATGNFAVAQSNFEKLAALEPNIAEVHATLAVIDFKLRAYDQAVKEIHTAQKLKPSLPKLDSLLGQSLAEMGRFKEALPGLEKGFKQTADPEVRRMCGLQLLRAYTGLNRDSDAVETALALNKFYPKDPEVLYHTGRIYGNIAYVVMERLHDEDPGSVWMLQAQGEANESEKNYDAAIVAFNHVLAIDPSRTAIHYRLGRVYLKRFQDQQKPEDRDAAVREFTAELAVDPADGNAAYELGTLAHDKGDLDEARKDYEQVVARFPDFEEALVGLAGVLLETQNAKEAAPLLEHATQLRPEDQVAWYRLALAQRSLGDRQASQTAMARYQELRKADVSLGLRRPSEEEVTPQKVGPETQP
jgi:tetratricopeptide (TPR) repeat protein